MPDEEPAAREDVLLLAFVDVCAGEDVPVDEPAFEIDLLFHGFARHAEQDIISA